MDSRTRSNDGKSENKQVRIDDGSVRAASASQRVSSEQSPEALQKPSERYIGAPENYEGLTQ